MARLSAEKLERWIKIEASRNSPYPISVPEEQTKLKVVAPDVSGSTSIQS